jgi:uncharacterized protein (DUF3084 family)
VGAAAARSLSVVERPLEPALVDEAERAVAALQRRGHELEALAERAAALDHRVRALLAGEEHLEAARAELAADVSRAHARAAVLERREEELARRARTLEQEGAAQAAVRQELAAREAALEARDRGLAAREERFSSRWRWLLRLLRAPRLRRDEVRECGLLMLPAADGYVVLEQEGLALRRGARVAGLLAEDREFEVTKIAPWAFDGRWCAYLQER